MSETIYQVLDRIEETAEALALPPDATPIDFLCAVYQSPAQPMHRRLRAAIECAPYVHPKFSVVAAMGDPKAFAAALEAAIARSGKARVIEHMQAEQLDAQLQFHPSKRKD